MNRITTLRSLSNDLKPFSSIPGPRSVPFFGTSWKYFPIIGNYDFHRLHEAGMKKLKEYGPVVKEEIVPGVFFVTLFDPEDIAKMYKAEGRYPERRSHLAVEHYRLLRPNIYNSGGLLPTNGSEWWRLRSAFQKSLSRIQDVRLFLPTTDSITTEFLNGVIKADVIIEDVLPLLSRLNLELTWSAVFGERLYSFDSSNLCENSIPSQIITAAEGANTSILGTDNTANIWKWFKTPLYVRLERHLTFIERIVLDTIDKLSKEKKHSQHDDRYTGSLIAQYLNCPAVDVKDVVGMAVDLILGGIDTTTFTSCFILYHLGVNKQIQEKLKDETCILLTAKNSPVTSDILNKATYTRAVLKEVFRLNPISVGISRLIKEDCNFSGYFVPAGTAVITQNQVACLSEKNFLQPYAFIPERWIRGSESFTPVSPFLVLPFSHGPRTCIARRLAEQNLLTFIAKVSRGYKIDWHGEKLGVITPLINKPDKPVRLSFQPRDL
ncbi:hypothetical protein AAG570_009086 [Ranatra chinensis]|uniref:Cytochrome P450 302a1, mitochondrial n=1 Tax=Ranatra chinensis TaxID=642074 RepID=A0ABD0YSQ2_9HEMI